MKKMMRWIAVACLGLAVPAALARQLDWTHYGADAANTKFIDAVQIDSTNFDSLRIIWSYPSPDMDITAQHNVYSGRIRSTPIVVDGVLYAVSPLNIVFAVDAVSGRELWRYDPEAWRTETVFRGLHRGASYWSDGEIARVFSGTFDGRLICLDAATGRPDSAFGTGGQIDLTQGLGRPVESRHYAVVSAPVICRDVVVVGSTLLDWRSGWDPTDIPNPAPPGDVRGFDARTGELLWAFHAIPREGEFGADTWEPGAWRRHGAANVWTAMSVDEVLGYVYLPFSTPSDDFYGGERPGANLFGESLVCLDVRTGQRIWHQQLVHHGLWDYDLPAGPILVDLVVDSQAIPAVVQVTKMAFAFVFDRRTGAPVWPIEERPVPASTVPGEDAWPTQPFPTRPGPFDRQGIGEEDLIDFTPELRREALEIIGDRRLGPMFTPPSLEGTILVPGTRGGADWAGAAVDPSTGVLWVPSKTFPRSVQLQDAPAGHPSRYAARVTRSVPGPRGLPLLKPPYGRLTAIDLNTGAHLWQVPTGKGPVDHPAIRHLELPDLGWGARFFVVATPKVLLGTSERAQGGGDYFTDQEAYLYAYDRDAGRVIGRVPLPANANGGPAVFVEAGRQCIVIPVGGEENAQLVALAIPRAGEQLPAQLTDRTDTDHPRFFEAVARIDSGDVDGLRQLLQDEPGLLAASGYLLGVFTPSYFRGATLLHHVAGNPSRVRLREEAPQLAGVLLQAGVDANAVTREGESTLALAATSWQARAYGVYEALLETLLVHGADPSLHGARDLHRAFTDNEAGRGVELLRPHVKELDLRFAAALGRLDTVRGFIAPDGSLTDDALTLYHPSPRANELSDEELLDEALNFAVKGGHRSVVEFLLDRGARINALPTDMQRVGEAGSTPLHKAVEQRDIEMVSLLLERGADPTIDDRQFNASPIGWANFFGYQDIVELLNAAKL